MGSAQLRASQGQARGRWNVMRRAEDATRAEMVISSARIVAVVADWSAGPVMVAAVGVRLNAMTPITSHTAFAVNRPEGRCQSEAPIPSSPRAGPARSHRYGMSCSDSACDKPNWNRKEYGLMVLAAC